MSYPQLPIAERITIHEKELVLKQLPAPLRVDEDLGILTFPPVTGQVVYRAGNSLFECRATKTPGGDYLLMFPTETKGWVPQSEHDVCHYGRKLVKSNDLIAIRSSDQGSSWTEAQPAFDIDYNQHGFIPLVPKGSSRIYCFGTQPIWQGRTAEHVKRGLHENAPIGYRYSDDDGHHWSEVRLIRPVNDPDFTGMSVMRMCETDAGTWLLGSHEGDWSYRPLMTRQYILRSEDQGKSWELLPHSRHGGWHAKGFNRMDEGRPINLGNGHVFFMTRTPEGHLWGSWSEDDGKTWDDPQPTPLIHPDAPPMLFHLSDGHTLIVFHHNRHHDLDYTGLSGTKAEIMQDRSEIWFSLSEDGGHTWSAPQFVFANALAPTLASPFRNYQCSYMDMFPDNGVLNLFVPHRWQQVLHLKINETDLGAFPTAEQLPF